MSDTGMELDGAQGELLNALDRTIADVGTAFDAFVKAAETCEAAGVPAPILQGKALELQQTVVQRMQGDAA